MRTYTTRHATIEAVQYSGTNEAELAELAGAGNVHKAGDVLQVRHSDGIWVHVLPGYWISRQSERAGVVVHSDDSFRRFFE